VNAPEQFAALKAIADGARHAEAQVKAQALADHEATGADRWRTPHGTVIVKNVDAEPTPVIADEAGFLAWVTENHPGEVETVVRVRPAFRDVMAKRLSVYPAADGGDPMVVDSKTGEVAPWAALVDPPAPQLAMAGGTDAKAAAAKAAAGRLFLDRIADGRQVLDGGPS